MPFELIVQSAFTERLDGGGVRIRQAGEHITDPDQVEALRGRPHVVQVWVDEKPAEPASAPSAEAELKAKPPLAPSKPESPNLPPAVAPSKN